MALTEHMREVAYQMFKDGTDNKAVARRIRQPLGSVSALKANWTRKQGAPAAAAPAQGGEVTTIRLRSTRVRQAIADGKTVQLVIEV